MVHREILEIKKKQRGYSDKDKQPNYFIEKLMCIFDP